MTVNDKLMINTFCSVLKLDIFYRILYDIWICVDHSLVRFWQMMARFGVGVITFVSFHLNVFIWILYALFSI